MAILSLRASWPTCAAPVSEPSTCKCRCYSRRALPNDWMAAFILLQTLLIACLTSMCKARSMLAHHADLHFSVCSACPITGTGSL